MMRMEFSGNRRTPWKYMDCGEFCINAKNGDQISVFLTGIKIKNDICLMAEERWRLLERYPQEPLQ